NSTNSTAVNSTTTKVQRKAPKKRTLAMEDDLPEALSAIPRKKRLCYLGDFDEADVTSPTKAQKLLQISQAAIMKHKQVVRNLRKSGKRLKNEWNLWKVLLEDLKEKSMISDAASSVLKMMLMEPLNGTRKSRKPRTTTIAQMLTSMCPNTAMML
ncbi:hypothetical protein JTE90_004896, partial [Oedothorax gibbosus]